MKMSVVLMIGNFFFERLFMGVLAPFLRTKRNNEKLKKRRQS